MIARENVRVGSIVTVTASGSGCKYNGKVVEKYPSFVVVEYTCAEHPIYDRKATVLRESYNYLDVEKVVKY